tara:strand:+ start:732 stop:1490 length:759 start_codon:yes stop_codon:yes gene_type:complete
MNHPITLITGASRGLGKSMALSLADAGHDIIITYQEHADAAESVVSEVIEKGCRAIALQLDLGESTTFPGFTQEVKSALETHWPQQKLDHLVNNAGMAADSLMQECNEDTLDLLYNVHFKGSTLLTCELLPLLNDGGAVLNVSSGLARFTLPGYGPYAAMKGAIETATKYWAKELGDRHIRVNVLAPGAIETDFGGGRVRDNADINQFVASQTALGRVGLPDDIGAITALLLSPAAYWITGQRIEASGGMFL